MSKFLVVFGVLFAVGLPGGAWAYGGCIEDLRIRYALDAVSPTSGELIVTGEMDWCDFPHDHDVHVLPFAMRFEPTGEIVTWWVPKRMHKAAREHFESELYSGETERFKHLKKFKKKNGFVAPEKVWQSPGVHCDTFVVEGEEKVLDEYGEYAEITESTLEFKVNNTTVFQRELGWLYYPERETAIPLFLPERSQVVIWLNLPRCPGGSPFTDCFYHFDLAVEVLDVGTTPELEACFSPKMSAEDRLPFEFPEDRLEYESWIVVAGSFRSGEKGSKAAAADLKIKLVDAGFEDAEVHDSRRYPHFACCYFSVVLGQFHDKESALALVAKLESVGFEAYAKRGYVRD